MPRDPFVIKKFIGGINNVADARDIADNELREANDVDISNQGRIDTLGGRALLKDIDPDLTTTSRTATVVPGAGFFLFRTARTYAGVESGQDWIALADPVNSGIDLHAYGGAGGTWYNNELYMQPNGEVDFTFIDDVLRYFDPTFSGSTNRPKSWRYIYRRKFRNATGTYRDEEWYEHDNDLSAPTSVKAVIERASIANNANGTDNIAFELQSNSEQIEPEWKEEWELAVSNVFDGNQESLLTIADTTIDLTDESTYQSLSKVRITFAINGTGAELEGLLDKRLTHKKVYMRKHGTDTWYLQGVYNMDRGGRVPAGDLADAWTYDASVGGYYYAGNTTDYLDVPLDAFNYKLETGHEPDIVSVDITGNDTGYRTAAICNRKKYVGYTRRKTIDNQIITEKDAIYPSDEGKYDRFRADLKIVTSPGEVVRLVAFGEKLLEYKSDSMTVINCGGKEYPESFHPQMGVERTEGACETSYGVVFCNRHGVFMYTNEGIVNLLETNRGNVLHRLISEAEWTSFYTVSCMPAYLPMERKLILMRVTENSTNKSVYVYDFINQSWTFSDRGLDSGSNTKVSKMMIDRNGVLAWVDGDTTATLRYWNSSPIASDAWKIITKDYDLGTLGTLDYVYYFFITYKNLDAIQLNNILKISLDGANSFKNTTIGNHAESASLTGSFLASKTDWDRAVFTLDKPVLVETIQLWILTGSSVRLSINDITIWHRALPNRYADT